VTCIVAVEHAGAAWVGSDSFVGTEAWSDVTDRPKFFRRSGLLVAFAGSFRSANIFQHQVKFRSRRSGEDAHRYLVACVAGAIREAFSKEGANLRRDGAADEADNDWIVCADGKAWVIQPDYSVTRSARGFAAAGAGYAYALGALSAMPVTLSPRKRILRALAIAADWSPQVRPPFYVEKA